MADPHTGEGFDAPPPAAAYADAPELLAEAAALLRLETALRTGQESPARYREYELRRAALADRYALAADQLHPGGPVAQEAEREAVRAARALAEWDRAHPADIAGPHNPGGIEWDPSQRPYVRQEYAAAKAGLTRRT